MIDFEKSKTLGRNPFISSGSVEPSRLWPTEELGSLLRGSRPARCPGSVLSRIGAVSLEELNDLVLPIAAELPFVNWHESTVEVLRKRAQNIVTLVEAVWATN